MSMKSKSAPETISSVCMDRSVYHLMHQVKRTNVIVMKDLPPVKELRGNTVNTNPPISVPKVEHLVLEEPILLSA